MWHECLLRLQAQRSQNAAAAEAFRNSRIHTPLLQRCLRGMHHVTDLVATLEQAVERREALYRRSLLHEILVVRWKGVFVDKWKSLLARERRFILKTRLPREKRFFMVKMWKEQFVDRWSLLGQKRAAIEDEMNIKMLHRVFTKGWKYEWAAANREREITEGARELYETNLKPWVLARFAKWRAEGVELRELTKE